MKKLIAIFFVAGMGIIMLNACRKEKSDDTDGLLHNEIIESGYVYFQNGNLLSSAAPSPHGSFKLRFNPIAFAALDSTGRLPKGSRFPDGSILVKEVYEGGAIKLSVVMKKDPSNKNQESDWLWAEFAINGSPLYSVQKKGQDCIGCHRGGLSRDLIRTFDLH